MYSAELIRLHNGQQKYHLSDITISIQPTIILFESSVEKKENKRMLETNSTDVLIPHEQAHIHTHGLNS